MRGLKSFANLQIFIFLLAIAVFGAAAFLAPSLPEKKNPPGVASIAEITREPLTITIIDPGSGGTGSSSNSSYRHPIYGFKVSYPSHLRVLEAETDPDTSYVVWENPNYSNAPVTIVYIQPGSSALLEAEELKGDFVTMGGRAGRKFAVNGNTLYWFPGEEYSLAIQFERPEAAGTAFDEWVDINSLVF